MTLLQIVLSVLCGLVGIGLVVQIVRDVSPGRTYLVALGLIEVGLVVQLVLGLARVFGDHEGVAAAAYVGYLVGALLILPIGLVWSLSERSRSGTAVLLVAVLLIPVLFVRLSDIWSAHV